MDHEWRIECWPQNITVTVKIGDKTYTHSGDPHDVRDTLNDRYGLNLGNDFGWNSDQVYGEAIPSTINARFEFFGVVAYYTVRVSANPIASVAVSDISRYVINRNWMWGWNDSNGDWHDGQWFRLDAWPYDATVTVTFKEGTGREPISGKLYEIEDTLREEFEIWWDSDETPENPWGPDEQHTATLYVANVPADYKVTVLPDPFRAMTVDDFTRYDNDLSDWTDYQDENGNHQDPGEYWRIECFPQNVTLTVEVDGETVTLTGDPGEVRDRLNGEYGFNLNDESWHWDSDQVYGEEIPETINATFEWGLLSAEYSVHVKSNPIESVTVSDISRYEYETRNQWGYRNDDGEWVNEEFPCIACWPWDADVTVTFKDGRKPLSGKLYEIEDALYAEGFDIMHEQDETPLNPWTAGGAYTSLLWIAGVPGEFKVHVLPDPVESLEVTGGITRLVNDRFHRMDWYDEETHDWVDREWDMLDCWPRNDASLTVTAVVDGVSYTGTADELGDALLEAGYDALSVDWDSGETPDNLWGVGTHTARFFLGGKSADYTVEVVAGEGIIGSVRGSGSATVALFPGDMDRAALVKALVDGDYSKAVGAPCENVSGSFTFEEPEVGAYYLTAAEDGYAPYVLAITVNGPQAVGEIGLYAWGDMNGDGKANADDALQILRFCQGLESGLKDNAYLQAAACVANRGALTPTAADATFLQKCAIGLASIG